MRVNLDKALNRWKEAGLLEAAAADAIAEFEGGRRNPFVANAAYLIGGFCVMLGIVALVAANWHGIPPMVKLALHFTANLGAGLGLVFVAERGHAVAREVLCLIAFGLVLTLISLIGQVYQLQSPTWTGLVLWMVLGSPLVWVYARGRFVLLVWLVALTVTLGFMAEPLGAFFETSLLGEYSSIPVLTGFYGTVVLVLMAGGFVSSSRGNLRVLSSLLVGYGLAFLVLAASVAQLGWYQHAEDFIGFDLIGRLFAIGWLGLLVAAVIGLQRRFGQPSRRLAFSVVMAVSLAVFALPFLAFEVTNSTVLVAGLFIGLWAVVGWAAARAQIVWVARLAVVVIICRLLAIYIEVFGTLALTGVGLVGSGIIVIAATFLALRLPRWITKSGGET